MGKQSYWLLLLTLVGIFMYSCQNDDSLITEKTDSNIAERSGEKIVLGEQLGNPYDINTMKQAFKNITQKKASGKFAIAKR